MERIVVYGTLRQGMFNQKIYLTDPTSYQGECYLKGTLYALNNKPYPALVLEGDHLVKAELYQVDDLAAMDKMEEYYGPNHPDNLYERQEVTVYDQSGKVCSKAQCYVYNMDRHQAEKDLGEVIISNDFVDYVNRHGKK